MYTKVIRKPVINAMHANTLKEYLSCIFVIYDHLLTLESIHVLNTVG